MGISDVLFGRKLRTTKETSEISTESESGRRKTTKKEIVTDRDSDGNIVSKTTTTEENEKAD